MGYAEVEANVDLQTSFQRIGRLDRGFGGENLVYEQKKLQKRKKSNKMSEKICTFTFEVIS